MIASKPSGFIIPLRYSEFFGSVPTRSDLESFVRCVEWRALVLQIVGILSVSWKYGVEDPEHQALLVPEMTKDLLYFPAIASRLQSEPNRRLFTRESLSAVLRVAVAESSPGDPTSDYSNAFTKAVLAANEILSLEVSLEHPTGTASDLLPSELRSAILHVENPSDLLARTDAFFAWSRTSKAQSSRNALRVEEDLHRFTGLTPAEYAAGAYFTLARFASMQNWPEVMRLGVAFSIEQWQAGMRDTRVIRQWFAGNSVQLGTVRTEWKAELSLSLAGAGSLWRKPVVQVEDDLYFVPDPILVQNVMGDGTYFALLDGYREAAGTDNHARKEALGRFTRFYGEFFEDHVASILGRAYEGRANALFTREVEYLPGFKSSDVIIAEGHDIIFVEVVTKRMNLIDSVLRLKPEAIAKDLEAAVLGKARQLDRNIRDFRAGPLLPNFPRVAGQRIFPVVVSPHDRPRINVITTALEVARKSQGLLADVEPLELLDLGEVEQLEAGLHDGISLSGLLDRKNKSTRHNRMMSLHNYLINVEPSTLPPGMSPTRRRGSEIAKGIIELAQTWIASGDENSSS